MSRFLVILKLYFTLSGGESLHLSSLWQVALWHHFFFLHRKGPSAVHCSSIKWRHREMLAVFSGGSEALPSYKDSVSFFEILRYLFFFFAFFNILAIILTIEINGS